MHRTVVVGKNLKGHQSFKTDSIRSSFPVHCSIFNISKDGDTRTLFSATHSNAWSSSRLNFTCLPTPGNHTCHNVFVVQFSLLFPPSTHLVAEVRILPPTCLQTKGSSVLCLYSYLRRSSSLTTTRLALACHYLPSTKEPTGHSTSSMASLQYGLTKVRCYSYLLTKGTTASFDLLAILLKQHNT